MFTGTGGGGREAAGVQETTATGPEYCLDLANRGELLAKFCPQVSERPNPPTHAYRHRGVSREVIGVSAGTATGQEKFQHLVNRGEPLAKF